MNALSAGRVVTFTEAGGHPRNEDALLVEPHPADPACLLVAVADGQGGQPGGAEAARVAVRAALDAAAGHPAGELVGSPSAWREILHRADDAVMADPDAGFASLVALAVLGDRAAGGSCGDAAALLTDPGGPHVLTDRQFKNPPVGSGDARFVPFAASPRAPWVLLAMTDGVWKYAGWDGVAAAARHLRGRELLDALAARCRLPGSGKFPDDFTLVVVGG